MKIKRIQKIFEPLTPAERLKFYNTALELNENDTAEIMMKLIENFERYEYRK